jgi:cytoskeletal protein CcmA (bactofilin family)
MWTKKPKVEYYPGGCPNNFTAVRMWTFRDTCNNVSSHTQIITVEDNEPPVIQGPLPQDLNLQCASDVPPPVALTATDNCEGDITVSPDIQIISGTSINDFTEIRTWTFADQCGNTSEVSQTITVKDDIPPIAVCKDIVVQLDENGTVIITPADIDNGSSDNCGGFTLELDQSEFNCENVGENTVVLTVIDDNGNVSNCNSMVTVNGILPEVYITQSELPEFCQGAVLLLTANSDEAIAYSWSTGEITPVIEISADNTYTVIVTSATNCKATADFTVNGFDAGALVSSYTLLAEEDIYLHHSNVVGSGGVGVTNNGKKVKLYQSSHVDDFIQASRIEIKNGSSAGNIIYAPANVTLPSFVYNTKSGKKSEDVKVRKNMILTLDEEVYGKVEIEESATVIFTSDNIYLDEIKSKKGASIEFEGCGNLYINKSFTLEENSTFNSLGNTVIVFVDGKVEVKEGCSVTARIHANDNDIHVMGKNNGQTAMNGMFIGRRIHGQNNVVWNMDRYCAACEIPVQEVVDNGNDKGKNKHNMKSGFIPNKGQFECRMYPNPTSGEVILKINASDIMDSEVIVRNITGSEVFRKGFKATDQIKIDLSGNVNGVYLVSIKYGDNQLNRKLILDRK